MVFENDEKSLPSSPLPHAKRSSASPRPSWTWPIPSIRKADHIRGPADADVTLVEQHGRPRAPDPVGQAEPVTQGSCSPTSVIFVTAMAGHLPLNDVHPGLSWRPRHPKRPRRRDAFWPMSLLAARAPGPAGPQGPNAVRWTGSVSMLIFVRRPLQVTDGSERVAADVESADVSGVVRLRTLFANHQRQSGAFAPSPTLSCVVRTARAQAVIGYGT